MNVDNVCNHSGNYKEHILCEYKRLGKHLGAFRHCKSHFFKMTDRARNKFSKQKASVLVCPACRRAFEEVELYVAHTNVWWTQLEGRRNKKYRDLFVYSDRGGS